MRVLVTGGAGFIGSHVVRRFLARGARVRVLDDFSTGRRENLDGLDAEVIEGDIRDAADVARAVAGCDAVVHLAARPSVARSMEDPAGTCEVNIEGTARLVEAVRAGGLPFVFASSSSVYGDTDELPKREEHEPRPKSPYGASKLAAELLVRQSGLPSVCLRFFNVFGPRQDPASEYAAVIPKFIACALRGVPAPVYGDGLQTRDFTYVEDVVDAVEAALARARDVAGVVVNIAAGEERSLLDLLEELERISGRSVARRHLPPRPGDIRRSVAAPDEAARRLGWRVRVGFREGLRRTFEWFRAAGCS